jgi:hypothetical protein
VRRFDAAVGHLTSNGVGEDLIRRQCLLTPSCGTGSLTVELAERVFDALSEVSRRLRS